MLFRRQERIRKNQGESSALAQSRISKDDKNLPRIPTSYFTVDACGLNDFLTITSIVDDAAPWRIAYDDVKRTLFIQGRALA